MKSARAFWTFQKKVSKIPSPIQLVEAGRVELPSESTSTGTSPSARDPLYSLTQAQVAILLRLVESSCVARSTLSGRTGTTETTPKPGSWSFRAGRPL